MPRSNVSALSWCLALAVMLTLSSCGRLARPSTGLTPRSEAVCDQEPPAPIAPQPSTEPERSAWVQALLGLYEDEVDKWRFSQPCRMRVREEASQGLRN